MTLGNSLDDFSFYEIDCLTRNDQFVLTYIADTNRAHYLPISQGFHSAHLLRAAAQYTEITTETIAGGTAANMTSGQMTTWIDDDNSVFAVFENSTGNSFGCAAPQMR